MKPKDLKSAFSFEQRRPCLLDQVFYVPIYYQNYDSFKLPAFYDYFANHHPVHVEYCSGNGDWIVEKAKQYPYKNWIAVEKRFDRVRKIWAKAKNLSLTNLLIVSGEALTFTLHYLPNQSIEEAYINFPDPWPKSKHAKNRLIQNPFLNELARILKPGKSMSIVTDDRNYATQTVSLFCAHKDFTPFFPPPYFCLNREDYGTSWFEQLWKEKGRQIHYLQFTKK